MNETTLVKNQLINATLPAEMRAWTPCGGEGEILRALEVLTMKTEREGKQYFLPSLQSCG